MLEIVWNIPNIALLVFLAIKVTYYPNTIDTISLSIRKKKQQQQQQQASR
jgi:hypothetical protein